VLYFHQISQISYQKHLLFHWNRMWVKSYIIPTVKKGCMVSGGMDRISLEIPFARLDDRAILPTQGSAQAAGWDLYAIEDTQVPKGATVLIKTGWAVAIPEGWEGQIRCRSSLGKKGMIMPNGLGTIDSDYRGELKVLATWIGEGDSFTVSAGERIAQLLFAPVPLVTLVETTPEGLDQTERGSGGFGSSGKF
jgi:dUTP pyrophosphatase